MLSYRTIPSNEEPTHLVLLDHLDLSTSMNEQGAFQKSIGELVGLTLGNYGDSDGTKIQ